MTYQRQLAADRYAMTVLGIASKYRLRQPRLSVIADAIAIVEGKRHLSDGHLTELAVRCARSTTTR